MAPFDKGNTRTLNIIESFHYFTEEVIKNKYVEGIEKNSDH